jgi:hypothetical protein
MILCDALRHDTMAQCDIWHASTGLPILNAALTSAWSTCPHLGHENFFDCRLPTDPQIEQLFDVYAGAT